MINFILPLIILFIISYGLYQKLDVFSIFIVGVRNGLDITIKIFPTLIGLITAVYMLRASGGIEILSKIVAPFCEFLQIPLECVPLMILKPISGGGGMAIGSEIIKNYGADSEIGRISAVMLASSETSFYTMSIYYGTLGIKNMKYTIPCVVLADFMAFLISVYVIKLGF